jgi:hypothetical protein
MRSRRIVTAAATKKAIGKSKQRGSSPFFLWCGKRRLPPGKRSRNCGEGEAMISGNMHERSQPRPSRSANEPVTFWEDVKEGVWVWLVILAVVIALLCHYADWSALGL